MCRLQQRRRLHWTSVVGVSVTMLLVFGLTCATDAQQHDVDVDARHDFERQPPDSEHPAQARFVSQAQQDPRETRKRQPAARTRRERRQAEEAHRPPNPEERLERLERKLDQLLQEVRQLRAELRRGRAPQYARPAPPPFRAGWGRPRGPRFAPFRGRRALGPQPWHAARFRAHWRGTHWPAFRPGAPPRPPAAAQGRPPARPPGAAPQIDRRPPPGPPHDRWLNRPGRRGPAEEPGAREPHGEPSFKSRGPSPRHPDEGPPPGRNVPRERRPTD